MSEKHKYGPDGILDDGVRSRFATQEDMNAYDDAQATAGAMWVARLYDPQNRHSRLFIANLDGTGNDAINDPDHMTNIGLMHTHLRASLRGQSRIKTDYIEGPGTQGGVLARIPDSALGLTHDQRVVEMYQRFVDRADQWIKEDPDAEISIIETGFSRGAEEALSLARLVDQIGIQRLTSAEVNRAMHGEHVLRLGSSVIRRPDQMTQALVVLDPVATGAPAKHDRSVPPSVVSVMQVTAIDEHRDLFPSTQVVPPGLSGGGRYLNLHVPGCHSNIGNSYHHNGLALLNYNMVVDHMNSVMGVRLLDKVALPGKLEAYTIQDSKEHQFFYSDSKFRHEGVRDILSVDGLGNHCRETLKCKPPEPVSERVAAMPRYQVSIGPTPPTLEMEAHRANPHHREQWRQALAHEIAAPEAYRAFDNAARGSAPYAAHPASNHSPQPANDPRNPMHRNHALYESINTQLADLHTRERIPVDSVGLERISAALLVDCRLNGMERVRHVQFGEDAEGRRTHRLLAYDVPDAELDDPYARFASINPVKAIDTPIEDTNRQLEAANLSQDRSLEQMQNLRQREMEQQHTQGRSM